MAMLTTTEAARILGVNQSRVRQLLLRGRLKGRHAGRDWRIRLQDLEAVRIRRTGRPRHVKE